MADGDTITVLDSSRAQHRVRLAGIDAPERGQPFGEGSKQALSDQVHGRTVLVEWSKTDRYGRLVATVWTMPPDTCAPPCAARIDVNLAQLDAGLAWHYKHFQDEQPVAVREAYAAAEQRARLQQLGIWSQPGAVPPWTWRAGTPAGPGEEVVRKSRSGICHAPDMASWSTVRRFSAFESMQACIASGGRPPRG